MTVKIPGFQGFVRFANNCIWWKSGGCVGDKRCVWLNLFLAPLPHIGALLGAFDPQNHLKGGVLGGIGGIFSWKKMTMISKECKKTTLGLQVPYFFIKRQTPCRQLSKKQVPSIRNLTEARLFGVSCCWKKHHLLIIKNQFVCFLKKTCFPCFSKPKNIIWPLQQKIWPLCASAQYGSKKKANHGGAW